jgi:hypothetical protein
MPSALKHITRLVRTLVPLVAETCLISQQLPSILVRHNFHQRELLQEEIVMPQEIH